MRLLIEGDDLVVPMPWWRRLNTFHRGPAPRMSVKTMLWVHPDGPFDVLDALADVRLSWRAYFSRGPVIAFTDPFARTLSDGGRAFVHRWPGSDSLLVRARQGSPWTTFLVSTRQGDELAAELVARGVPLRGADQG